jgi:hypothetical protein
MTTTFTTPRNARQAAAALTLMLAEVQGELRHLSGPGAQALEAHSRAHSIAAALRDMGATVHLNTTPPRMTWHGITATRAEGGLALFAAWLARAEDATRKAGAA